MPGRHYVVLRWRARSGGSQRRAVHIPHVAAISDPCDEDLDLHESGFGDLDLTVVGQGGKPGWSSSLGRGCMRMGDGFMDISFKKICRAGDFFRSENIGGASDFLCSKNQNFFLKQIALLRGID